MKTLRRLGAALGLAGILLTTGAPAIALAQEVTEAPVEATGYFLTVDGVTYQPSQESGPVRHYETPDVEPVEAFSDRHVWTGNGSELLPCPGGIHWIDNESLLTISHCLEVPPSTTTTTTTTEPPTTTTSTTVPETTTTTTVPETTTTTVPVRPLVDVWCEWDNHDKDTGVHEPIISFWHNPQGELAFEEWRFTYAIYDRAGNVIDGTEFGPATPGYHDSWGSGNVPVPEDGFVVEFYVNNVLEAVVDDPDCRKAPEETTTTTEPPEETTTTTTVAPDCDEDHPTYDPETGKCELPFTGANDWVLPTFLTGLAITGAGVGLVLTADRLAARA